VLSALLQTIPVSLLSSDPYQVCMEGAHFAVWYTALGGLLLFSAGTIAAGLATLHCARRLPWQRPPATATSAAALTFSSAVARSLVGSDVKPAFSALPFMDKAFLAAFVGLLSLSKRADSLVYYVGVQSAIGALALVGVGTYMRLQPYTPASAWKRVINALLYFLTFLSSSMNSLLYAHAEGRRPLLLSADARYALGVLPPAFALLLLVLLLWSWWSALLHSKEEKGGGREEAVAQAQAEAVVMMTSPMLAGRGAQSPRAGRSPHKGAAASAPPSSRVSRLPPPPLGPHPAHALVSFADYFAALRTPACSAPPPPLGAPPEDAFVSFADTFAALPTLPSPSPTPRAGSRGRGSTKKAVLLS